MPNRDVADRVQIPVLATLAGLMAAILALPSALRIRGIYPNFMKFLNDRGLLRTADVSNNLHEALLDLVKKHRPPASGEP